MTNNVWGMGEDMAVQALREAGYSIRDRNFHCRWGELDIVACRGREMVFVEVKTRTSSEFGQPHESVTSAKRERIKKAARFYVAQQKEEDFTYRFDVICVSFDRGRWHWQWYKDAFI